MTESMPESDVVVTNKVGESAVEATAQKTSTIAAAAAADGNPPPIDAARKKKKSGAFAIFKAALSMLRKRRPGEKKAKSKTISKQKSTASVSSGRSWAKFVGSMRPLSGLQETAMSPPHQPSPVAADVEETKLPQKEASAVADENETIPAGKEATAVNSVVEAAPPASPAVSSSSSSSSRGTMSRYASAASLRDLYCSDDDDDEDEEEEDPDEVFDAITGDEMIDAKAEEFIAQFYKQIQLQNTSKTHHHYHNRGI